MSYDLLMLLVVAATIAWGIWKGFAWQLASLASIFSSYGAAYALRAPVAKLIDAEPPINTFAAMLVVYLFSSAGIWVGFGLISRAINGLALKDFDRQLGGVFGAAQGAILCLLVTFFAVTLSSPTKQEAICRSYSGRYIAIALKKSGGLIPQELHAVVEPFLNPFAQKLDQYQAATTPPPLEQPYNPTVSIQPPAYEPQYDPRYDPRNQPRYEPQYDPRYDAQYDPRYDARQRQIDPRYADPRYETAPYADPRYAPPQPRYEEPPPSYRQRAEGQDPRYYWR